MPTYDYECTCGNVQEEFHSMRDTPKIICKKCNSKNMVKVVSGTHQINMNNHPGSALDDV